MFGIDISSFEACLRPTLDEQILSWNPWWANPGAVANDPHIRAFERASVRGDPPLLHTLPLTPGDAHTLRGPRQAGKTTLAKRIIRRLVEAGETRVLYFSLDLQSDSAAQVLVQANAVPGAVGYWRSTNNRELDFVVPAEEYGRGGRLPIEVKGDDGSRIGHARLAIRKAFGNGIVVSRSVFEPSGEVPVLPAPVFLAGLREVRERVASIA